MPQTEKKNETAMCWNKAKVDAEATNYYFRKNFRTTIDTTNQPKTITVKGQYGEREMYILQTNLGRLLVDSVTFSAIYDKIEPFLEQHSHIEIVVENGAITRVVPK